MSKGDAREPASVQGRPDMRRVPLNFANHSVRPGSDVARKMTVTSGLNLSALLQRSDPVGLWLKMCVTSERFISTRCYLTWRGWATPQRRPLYRLVPSMPRTNGISSGLWHTPRAIYGEHPGIRSTTHLTGQAQMWPTPDANSGERFGQNPEWINPKRTFTINDAVRMWPTASARDWKSGKASQETMNRNSRPLNEVATANQGSGQLNPEFVEWLMGFPIGFTDLEPSEML